MNEKPLDILVVEDELRHQDAAKALLQGHNLTLVDGFDYALDVLKGVENYHGTVERKHFDVVLSDLMFPQGRGDMQGPESKTLAHDPLPFGFPLAIIAARQGVKHIAVVTDMDHHAHPIAYTLDHLKNKAKYSDIPARIPIAGANVIFFDTRDLPAAYMLKSGKVSTESIDRPLQRAEVQFPEDLKTDYKRTTVKKSEFYPEGICFERKDSTYEKSVKNWKAALDKLIEGEYTNK